MSNTVFESALSLPLFIAPNGNVVFGKPIVLADGLEYDETKGIIKFNETGQYLAQWWVATETTLKGVIGFELYPSQGRVTPGCMPIKTGQVSGFGVINIQSADITLSLRSISDANVMLSRKTDTTAYMLITRIDASPPRVYRGDLSKPGSYIQVPLGNGLYYRLDYVSPAESRLYFIPMNGPVTYDFRRFAGFDGGSACEGEYSDNASLTESTIKDLYVYKNSREMHWVLVRVQNPVSTLWSTYEVRLFSSNGAARTTIWVNVIEEEVSY